MDFRDNSCEEKWDSNRALWNPTGALLYGSDMTSCACMRPKTKSTRLYGLSESVEESQKKQLRLEESTGVF